MERTPVVSRYCLRPSIRVLWSVKIGWRRKLGRQAEEDIPVREKGVEDEHVAVLIGG